MTTKEFIIKELVKERGKYISGEILAKNLNISRAGISKAIKELKIEGYLIKAVPNKGYSLNFENNILSSEIILQHLKKTQDIYMYKTIDSTNKMAKLLNNEQTKHGTIIIANEQTEGRGRLGRSFYSPADTGLYMTVILKPNLTLENSLMLTIAAAVAVANTIKKFIEKKVEIKWVNDIYVEGKKVAGILTEAVSDFESGNIESIILGIGINLSTVTFPEDIKDIAGSLLAKDITIDKNIFVSTLINEIMDIIDNFNKVSIIENYRKYLNIIGKEITVLSIKGNRDALAMDIDEKGQLIIKNKDESIEILNYGEISIRKK